MKEFLCMAKMKSDTPIDYAIFQLSPKRSRCELFVSSDGSMEKLASGLLKPFVAHLRVAEEQVASAAQSVKLEVGRRRNAELWFTKGTLERFVRFVSTPEVLELVNTFDAEMSQLEAARRIYSQGVGDHHSGGGGSSADDATKKELLRAIDVRLVAVQQDLSTACARAAAAGFDIDSVSELQLFADRFGAHRLNEACGKFLSLCETRPNLVNQWKPGPEDLAVRASYGSDMSIDDDPPSPAPRQESTTSQQSNSPSIAFPIRRTFSREPSIERDDGDRNKPNNTVTEKDDKDESSTTPESIQSSQPARRLSVQDRISLFENKQKETSGGKPVVVKPSELRRLSSDVSLSSAAAEKAVLRRWSGASDMSIDLSSEKKDVESPLYTPSSLTASQDNKVLNSNDNTTKNSSIVKPEIKVIPSISRVSDGGLREGSFNRSEQFFESSKSNSNLGSGEIDDLKDEGRGKIQSGSFISRAEHQDFSEENPKTLPGGKADGVFGIRNQGKSKLKGSHSCGELNGPHTQIAAKRDQGSPLTQSRTSGSKGDGQVEISNPGDDSESRDESATQTRFNSTRKAVGESGVFEAVAGSRIREAFASRYKGVEGDSLPSQQEIKSFGKAEVVEKKESHASKKVSSSSVSNSEDSGSQKMKFGKQGSAAALSKKVQVQRDEINFSGNTRTSFARETQEGFDSFSTPPPDQTQRMRPSKGNQELNDELKMKANELEKLFAEHKLRAPGDQSNSARKGKTEDTRREPTSNLHYKKPVEDITPQVFDGYQWAEPTESSKNKTNFNASSPVKTIDSQNYGDTLNKNFSELSVSEGSRGKVYNRYMQKRDAKLREEWSSNRVEKEARLKSMQDSLERNRSEMKTKISGSADKQDSISSSRRRAERLQSYNIRSMMIREQQHLDFGDSEDEDEALDRVCEDGALDGTSFENDMSQGAQGKKILPNNRSLLSSTPRTSAAPVPRSATKTSTINSGKRRMQPENPLAQSVPNFSDLRKENTRPSSGGSKVTRLQVRNYSRSKSISEEAMVDKATIDKEDKSHRSQSLRKSSAFPNECEEMPSLDSDGGVVLTPIKFEEEVPKSATTKPFLKKGSRTGFTARASIARQKASVGSNPIKYVEGNDYLATGPDDVVSGVKDEGDEDFETLKTEGNKILDNGEQRIELESDKFRNSGSENSDGTPTFSHVDHALGSQLPYEISSNFLPVESMQDWPGESPMSWISRNQNPFSYPHEMSDVDASVDSPVGSPASWNSHSLNQMEADAARMRKKWGTAQKPMLVNNSSNHLPRKDMTRGFKRFLKFGRKNRASESLVDWISATTSEGDDDTEDGRDLANRSSEDLRKSRMGFSQAQASDYGFSESELFGESVQSSDSSIPAPPSNFKLRDDHMSGSSIKAPRSFFSLSTFRSKGSDSKPR